MEIILQGESSVLEALRRQWTHATIVRRELTGCGFFTYLAVDRAVSEPTTPRRLAISGPHGEIAGLAHGVGFVLFVEEGYLSFLEGFSYDEPWWPRPDSEFQLTPLSSPRIHELGVRSADGSSRSRRAAVPGDDPSRSPWSCVDSKTLETHGDAVSEVHMTAERAFLEAGVACVLPALQRRGFAYALGDIGVASGGPFATCQFSCGRITMGLIVRRAHRLGSPTYSIGAGYAGHEDLVWAIGRSGEESLVSEGYIDGVSRDGGDAFEALRKDLETIVLPVLDASRANFEEAIERAVARVRARLGWG